MRGRRWRELLSALCRLGNWWSLLDDLPRILVFYVWRPCDVRRAGWRAAAEWRVALGAATWHCDKSIGAQITSLDLSRHCKLSG